MSSPISDTSYSEAYLHAQKAAETIGKLPIVPDNSTLSKVLNGSACNAATVSLALQDLTMLVNDMVDGDQTDCDELVRIGLLLVSTGIQNWSGFDPDHHGILGELNGPAEK